MFTTHRLSEPQCNPEAVHVQLNSGGLSLFGVFTYVQEILTNRTKFVLRAETHP